MLSGHAGPHLRRGLCGARPAASSHVADGGSGAWMLPWRVYLTTAGYAFASLILPSRTLGRPPTVKALQSVVGSARGVSAPSNASEAFAMYSKAVDFRDGLVLRNLLEIRPAAVSLDVEEVETAASLCRRFVASAMSLGSLSPGGTTDHHAGDEHDRWSLEYGRRRGRSSRLQPGGSRSDDDGWHTLSWLSSRGRHARCRSTRGDRNCGAFAQ